MKEKKIRRIPVVNGDGKLVGIVSDRDLKDVSPSRATTLDIWELHYVLDKLKIGDIMTKKPGHGDARHADRDGAAQIMMDKRVEGLPVLDAKGAMVGILTEGDVFRALVDITGVGKRAPPGRPPDPGQARLASARSPTSAGRPGGKIFSILGSYAKVPAGKRELDHARRVPETRRPEGRAHEGLRRRPGRSRLISGAGPLRRGPRLSPRRGPRPGASFSRRMIHSNHRFREPIST